jgi:hypothetical protein
MSQYVRMMRPEMLGQLLDEIDRAMAAAGAADADRHVAAVGLEAEDLGREIFPKLFWDSDVTCLYNYYLFELIE